MKSAPSPFTLENNNSGNRDIQPQPFRDHSSLPRGPGFPANASTGAPVVQAGTWTIASRTKKLCQDPLFHFILLGGLIFGLHSLKDTGGEEGGRDSAPRIEIDAATITRLKEAWTRQFGRPPDKADLQGQVEAHIREEVLFREALTMGLDRNDTIVRRRLAQKLEFLTQDISMSVTPDEAALGNFFEDNAARYAPPPLISFRHVYFSREKRGALVEPDASAVLAALADSGVSDETSGDPFLHDYVFTEMTEQNISGVFGTAFASSVARSSAGSWMGPVESSYGLHLVLITGRRTPPPVGWDSVRDQVMRDLLDERRRSGNDEVVTSLRNQYHIVIDKAALETVADTPPGAIAE